MTAVVVARVEPVKINSLPGTTVVRRTPGTGTPSLALGSFDATVTGAAPTELREALLELARRLT